MAKETKTKESKYVTVQYGKYFKKIKRKQYEAEYEKRIRELETIGVVIQDIYFSKSSESIYVTFILGKRSEKRLNLKDKRYIGQFAISSHERFYDTAIKTFFTQKAKDVNDMFKRISEELNMALAYEDKIHQYVVTVEEPELETLRIIGKLNKQQRGFEVEQRAFLEQKNFPVFYTEYRGRRLLRLIEDEATNNILLSLRYKNCIQAYNEGVNNRERITLNSLGNQLLLEYGEDPSDDSWIAFCSRMTLDLWQVDEIEPETETATATPDEELPMDTHEPKDRELAKLNISADWYSAFAPLFYKLQKGEGLVKGEYHLWREIMEGFVETNLPESQEFIHVGFIPSEATTTIFIGEDSELEGATLYEISCANDLAPTEDYISMAYADKQPVEFLSQLVNWFKVDHAKYHKSFVEEDLRTYLQLKFLERTKVALTTTEFFLNNKTVQSLSAQALPIYMEQRLKKKTTVSPAMEDENIARMFKLLCKLRKNQAITVNPTDKKRIRLATSASSDAIFQYVESEMLFVRDNILYEDKPEYPIVQDVEKGLITYINPASLLSVQ